MIHLPNAASQLGGVRRPVRLPIPAQGAPSWAAIRLADEDLLAVEQLEARAVRVHVDRRPVWLRLLHIIGLALIVRGLSALLAQPQSIIALVRQRDQSRLVVGGVEGSDVSEQCQDEEDEVEGDEGGSEAMLVSLMGDVVN